MKNGFIAACAGLCILAEGVDAHSIPELLEARKAVIEYYMPKGAYLLLNALSNQADGLRREVKWEAQDEMFISFGFDKLTEVDKKAIEDLFGLENRSASFMADGLLVHPTKEILTQIQRRNSSGGLFYLGARKPR